MAVALLVCWGAATAQPAAQAAVASAASASGALQLAGTRCESAVAAAVREARGREVHELRFGRQQRAPTAAGSDEVSVKGEGRYRAPSGPDTPFTYGCAFDSRSGRTSGVVFRDERRGTPGSDAPWQPDLSHLSADECDSAAAAAFKRKYPRVESITFNPESRRLRPGPNNRTLMEGLGAVRPAPGMNALQVSYRCEFEPKTQRPVTVQTGD